MTAIVVLDTGPLGLLTHPRNTPESVECKKWLRRLLVDEVPVVLPEIADYELRRELIRARSSRGLKNLDDLGRVLDYLPITTQAIRQAAAFWAIARQQGRPAANDRDIDADMILAGQTVTIGTDEVVVATTNVKHLERFVTARTWKTLADSAGENP